MKLIPILKEHSWRIGDENILREKFLHVDFSPWVAYAIDEGKAVRYLSFSDSVNKTSELTEAKKLHLKI